MPPQPSPSNRIAEAPGAAAAGPLAPDELLRRLDQRMGPGVESRQVLLVVALNRPDRLLALAQDDSGRAVRDEIAARVQALLRPEDRYAFASHEELWVMLADLPSEALAELAAHALLQALRRPIEAGNGRSVQLRPSIGGAWAAREVRCESMGLLATASDAATRAQASESRLEIVCVHAARSLPLRRDDVERDLHRALEANELELHYQPQVDLRSGRCDTVEALIRWRRTDGRIVDPSTIASVCEERGLIDQLTHFALNTALRQRAGWTAGGVEITVAINLSALTLSDGSFPQLVARALDTWGQAASSLTLELTESALVRNERTAIGIAHQLRDLGCRLSIDDFGTGYSSLNYLRQFPLDELKIDQSFVRHARQQAADLRIVRALVGLSHAFGLHAIAEGVEDAGTLELLHSLGCDRAQGWHLSRALPAERLAEWCLNRNRAAAISPPPGIASG